MKKTLIGLLALVMIGSMVSLAQAVDVTVRVTIISAVGITVVSGTLIDFGEMAPNAAAVVLSTSTVIKNTGSGVAQTYKMSADHPGDWSTGTTPDHNVYVLQALFNGSEPTPVSFESEDTLTSTEITASDSVLAINVNYTGVSVAWDDTRSIWYKFQPPVTSSLTGQQDITVTITAEEG